MTENKIKKMLSIMVLNMSVSLMGQVQNFFPAKYYEWRPYKLGEEIREDFDYRKVEK